MRSLHIPVLYGSQTGNSELAAENLAKSIPEALSTSTFKVTATAIQLDDFLEVSRAQWTPLCAIVCSSYGVGQAPIGSWKFREVCDLILESSSYSGTTLKGLKYALLGLGDSKYTTFFMNPTVISSGMDKAGAERIGRLGKADASGEGDKNQLKVIEEWSRNIIPELKRAAVELEAMTDKQWSIKGEEVDVATKNFHVLCRQVYDTWDRRPSIAQDFKRRASLIVEDCKSSRIVYAIVVLLLAGYLSSLSK
eukprot:CAMPEP_0194111992 /NCGR_PEP_ID=MMETSP0150-20130528/10856_1 /TAXON_ID=122233 /ORGANISM="Chaetoceros debilis, Strain MM31A-1" /LENGTH=250 /DNA_ID=CAMNT_0038801557 /DNA_START=119 /DNA_END=871 /DNA_ORIENTATION=+